MRKLIICLSFAIVSLSIAAQDSDSILRSKKGIPILPQKGDWAIGANAAPYLRYLGNIFNNSTRNSLTFDETTLYGRYYLSGKTALRFTLSMGNSNDLTSGFVPDDAAIYADPLSRAKTTDTRKVVTTSNYADVAYLKFRGYGRLLGFYGAHAGFGFSRTHTYYTYGNPITTANAAPNSINDWNNLTYTNIGVRTLEQDNSVTKTAYLGLVAGIEYYFAPKMCIGTEIALNAAHSWKSQGNSVYERLNGTNVEEYDIADSPKGRTSTTLSTRYAADYGSTYSLYLMFHF
jgi:hypothetical protein